MQATAVAPDGSVYVLANVNATTGGAAPAGGQDVALQKYDSAGKLMFSSDLGSAASASGLSLAVSADGSQVAVAGQVTGSMTAGQTVNDPTGANSFVAVYDSQGDQVWTQQDDGADAEPGERAWRSARTARSTSPARPQTTTAPQGAQGPERTASCRCSRPPGVRSPTPRSPAGGSNTSSGIAVDGTNVYVAGVQNGDAVVTEYDLSNPERAGLRRHAATSAAWAAATIAGVARAERDRLRRRQRPQRGAERRDGDQRRVRQRPQRASPRPSRPASRRPGPTRSPTTAAPATPRLRA